MKKLNTEALEKMAKSKNIDKDKIEKIADGYKGKSENELMDELVKIGQTLQGRDEVVSKFKAFLDDEQKKKLDVIMNKISDAEVQSKVSAKKTKQKTTKQVPSTELEESNSTTNTSTKKVKKVVKKVKKKQ